MLRRSHLQWKLAGSVADAAGSGDDVVRRTGWVFNNVSGASLTLAEFVKSGDDEVEAYLRRFDLKSDDNSNQTLVEIGSGIGRMTSAFTREFGSVIACDLDSGFLERCHEVVSQYGVVERLRTLAVPDGRTIDLPPNSVDIAFSYITLQHCTEEDALSLVSEAVRVVRPGGTVALNFRLPSRTDPLVLSAGKAVRAAFRMPALGPFLARRRLVSRVGWQVSRLSPNQVIGAMGPLLSDNRVWLSPSKRIPLVDGKICEFPDINPNHWWLVATPT